MDLTNAIAIVNSEWEPETGFFWKLRQGTFEEVDACRALAAISAIPTLSNQEIPARLVSVLWYIPIFMQWQTDRVRDCGGNMRDYAVSVTLFTNQVERILGVP
jgi:hypothetical protein